MGVFRFENPTRLGAAGSLLLLLIAQQKLCPWMVAPPEAPPDAAERCATQAPGDPADAEPRPAPKPLLYIVPDAPAPRWAPLWTAAAAGQSAGWHDGVISCGPPRGAIEFVAACPADPSRPWTRGEAFVAQRAAPPPDLAQRDPGLETCVIRTGPPDA
jgi:hypothetical protein